MKHVILIIMDGLGDRPNMERDGKTALGYFIGNDVSSRLLQYRTSQFYLGKSFDGFYPNGPYIAIDEIKDPHNLKIQTMVNGDLRQDSNTSYMIFPMAFRTSRFPQNLKGIYNNKL